ncbi:Electron transfer flavoprotein alpha-subunit [Granulibacter bethesdensis]|uniref:Electron transfer flavoprotein subunit alpha n=1 Tax=Granulibacter bethesdensis TaxID=364410 RepID=A0AAC9P9B7_9PROT|nr:FAD-binding protein [Granulibacter bethesdensis]APH55413.1 Electron transfer flavoprotein alpha-subunit [Granulibacter bethesdensis]APH62999.1 Electron transfer flavoprotein alpha-subunit [Granulibacter bethesdensis]
MTALVLAEHDGRALKQATRSAIAAAQKLGGDLHILVAGQDVGSVAAQAAAIPGVSRVVTADAPSYAHALAEPLAALLVALAPHYSHILAPASATGKNVLPRAAALLDVQPISDICGVESADTFVRPIYAGNALATVRSADPVKVITVRAASFEPVPSEGGAAEIVPASAVPVEGGSRFVSEALTASERPELGSARIVISGGKGMQSAENFELLDRVARKLNAAVGASRAAVDAGYAPNDYQVGQTGKIVAPELYIAVGISGAIQHLAGMKDSRVIVAINKDPDAPIFQVADYGYVGDLFEALPALEKAL